MIDLIDFNSMVNDGSVWLAIIAINMTIIGLTSLAETKNVIGIDYGKYLIKSYKVVGSIRIYHLLVLFAIINVVSLLSMFIMNPVFRTVNFTILIISLVFAIYYFFSYILVENNRVRKQIIKSELLGMYYDNNHVTNFEADLITHMKNGYRTNKRLSTDVILFFDKFNTEAQKSFEEVFGPRSVLYDDSKRNKNYWKKHFDEVPYNYSVTKDINHISHEFFQLYRYSELQEKWLLEILRLFSEDHVKDYPEQKLNNLIRVIAHVNTFGKQENLYSYKFLEYLSPYIKGALSSTCDDMSMSHRLEKENFLMKSLFTYIIKTIDEKNDKAFYKMSISVYKKLFVEGIFIGKSNCHDHIDILFNVVKDYESTQTKAFAIEVYTFYQTLALSDKRSVKDIQKLYKRRNIVPVKNEIEDIFAQ